MNKPHHIQYIAMLLLWLVLAAPIRVSARDFAHIFTSKGIYETCEDLWFKCFMLNDSTFELSDEAHTAFVEIVNPADSVVWKEKYPIINGECAGQVYVGGDWQTGEYRMYVHTRNTLGLADTVMTPKRLLIVNELPEAQKFVSGLHRNGVEQGEIPEDFPTLVATVELDSAEYHTRSKVKARISITDPDGNPVKARIALSVYDRLYDYPPSNLDIVSHCIGIRKKKPASKVIAGSRFLSDGAVAGRLKSGKKNTRIPLDGQLINVFDYTAKEGSLNIVSTTADGHFEIPSDMAASLGRDMLLKPVSGQKMKPQLEFQDPFKMIADVRRHSKDLYFPILAKTDSVTEDDDTLDYAGRHVMRLDEIVVKGNAGRYPKRNKVLGYLDSISTLHGGAWVCGCPAGYGTSFLNDYVAGYTHHPIDASYAPMKISRPIKGKSYTIVKYTGGNHPIDYLLDIKIIEYTGPKYSEEDLLRKNGLWKTRGYYPRHKFLNPDEDEMSLGLEDNRNTLLWTPEASTDENGEFVTEFYTSDIQSQFIINGIAHASDSSSPVGLLYQTFTAKKESLECKNYFMNKMWESE